MGCQIKRSQDGYEFAVVPMSHWMRQVGVPVRLADAEWDLESDAFVRGIFSPEPMRSEKLKNDLKWLSQWSRSDNERFVVIHAPKGRGKTTYAAATMRRCLGAHPKPKWVSWPRLVSDVTDSWSNRDAGEGDMLQPVLRCGFLVLDDFGKELTGSDGRSLRDWQLRIAFTLINGRYERMLPTLITTELSQKDMMTRLDAAITSRMMEDGRWIDLGIQPDYRMMGK